ncbi:MAG: hypothetical protein HQL12_00670 [Candidatus Omnitrophica bacterium]|nr:hypothetical protein [Candidatus Omnitrophota bacterium]
MRQRWTAFASVGANAVSLTVPSFTISSTGVVTIPGGGICVTNGSGC